MDVGDGAGFGEERGDLLVGVAGDAAADTGHEEGKVRTADGKLDEILHFAGYRGKGAAHGGDGIAPALESASLAQYSPELLQRNARCTCTVVAIFIAAEDKDLPSLEFAYPCRGDAACRRSSLIPEARQPGGFLL